MFKNEVIVDTKDKEEALTYIEKVNEILDKYPSFSCIAYTVTSISRAKEFSREAEKWIGYLETKEEIGLYEGCR